MFVCRQIKLRLVKFSATCILLGNWHWSQLHDSGCIYYKVHPLHRLHKHLVYCPTSIKHGIVHDIRFKSLHGESHRSIKLNYFPEISDYIPKNTEEYCEPVSNGGNPPDLGCRFVLVKHPLLLWLKHSIINLSLHKFTETSSYDPPQQTQTKNKQWVTRLFPCLGWLRLKILRQAPGHGGKNGREIKVMKDWSA